MKTVAGGFINDADYVVQPTINGKRVWCPFYRAWHGLAERSGGEKFKLKRTSYVDVECCEEWKLFSVFKGWMESQPWKGMSLDKDILVPGCNIYSPATCAFVPDYINNLLLGSAASRGLLPLGVTKVQGRDSYMCQVRTGERSRRVTSYHSAPMNAHKAWQRAKADVIVAQALRWFHSDCEAFREPVMTALLDRAYKLRQDADLGIETKKL